MDRQFPSAEGTGPTVRRPTGRRSGPRLSALRYPLMGMRRVRNRQFGTTVRRDAPRGNAPARLNNAGENHDAEICAANSPRHAAPCAGHPRLASRQSKAWMAGTSPAMTNVGFWRNEPEIGFGETNPRAVLAKRT